MENTMQTENTDPTVRLAALRAERLRLLEERKATERACVPLQEARERVTAWLDSQGARWPKDAASLVAPLASATGLDTSMPAYAWNPIAMPAPQGSPGDFVAFTVAMHRPQLEAALLDGLARFYEQHNAATFTTAARTERLAELDAQLDAIETAEEQTVLALEARGAVVSRRADARPEIIMAVLDAA